MELFSSCCASLLVLLLVEVGEVVAVACAALLADSCMRACCPLDALLHHNRREAGGWQHPKALWDVARAWCVWEASMLPACKWWS